MKKYIRTESGVYELYDTRNGATNHWGYRVNERLTMLLDEESLKDRKTSDSIEELIDVYVCNELIFLSMEQLNHYCYIRNKDIYGAVWTSKGLIYVAKMDKDGELELL